MFLDSAWRFFGSSHALYFSSLAIFSISLPIAAVRAYQVLYRKDMKKSVLASTEAAVELFRIAQYVLYLALGTGTPVRQLFTAEAWRNMFAGVRHLEWMPFLTDLLGYVIVFGLYNAILFLILRKPAVQAFVNAANIRRFDVSAVRNALMLAYKNLFLIPVSFIYLFYILKIL